MKPGGRGTTRPGTFTWNDGLSFVVEIESFSRNVMSRIFSVAFSVAVFSMSTAAADDARQVVEMEIDASLDSVWNAFTTTEGVKSWVAPLADIDFRIGGKWRANYNVKGKLGDDGTIEHTILCYDPKRMMSIRTTKCPKGFPFAAAAKQTWTVFYFTPVTKSRTRVRVVGLGYTDSEQSRQLRSFLDQGNRQSLKQLAKALTKQREDRSK